MLTKNYINIKESTVLILFIPLFQLASNSGLLNNKFPELNNFESCSLKSSSFINVENINFEIIYLAIYPEVENIKCLLSVHSYNIVDNYATVIYYSSPFIYLFSFIIFAILLILLHFKKTNTYLFNILFIFSFLIEIVLYNGDVSFLINTILFFIFIIFMKNSDLSIIYNNTLLLIILYSLSSKHLVEFLIVKFQLSFDPIVFFEIVFLIIVLYIANTFDKPKNLKIVSFVPLLGVLLLVFESLYFALNKNSRGVYYFLFLITILFFISNKEIKLNKYIYNLVNSSIFVLTIYFFLAFLNSDYFINKLFPLLVILIIVFDFIEVELSNKIFENKIFSLFVIIFFLSQVNINDYFQNNNNIENSTFEEKNNLNVVHILFDGLPGSVTEEMFYENKINNFHIYSNFYSTAINTQPSISDMLTGSNFDDTQPFFEYYYNLPNNPENYLNKLNDSGVRTHLITDRFINDIIFQDTASLFDFKLINRGENENFETYTRFYENKIPNIYTYRTVPDGKKIIIDYILDMLIITRYDVNVVVERGALVGIDNLAKFYDLYKNNLNGGQNYYYIHIQIPHIPFVMDKDCNYIERIVGDSNNSPEIINGHIECAKKLIGILSEKIQSKNTLLLIHGDHSLNEIISEEDDYIKEKLNAGLLIRYPNFDYQSKKSLVLVDEKFFSTDLGNLITNYYTEEDSFLKNINLNEYLNVVDGLADNYKNKDVNIIKVETSDW
jgi:hypothetical protein